MIKGYCRTNLDEGKKHSWPEMFVAVPRIGERVQAMTDGTCSCLKVVGITHRVRKNYTDNCYGSLIGDNGKRFEYEPIIEVELNK